jgi:DNA polymerase-4
MRAADGLRYLILDFNAYFASVEQQENPRLRGRPVAVVPMADTDSTCVIAASYEAKRFGVTTGTRIFEARKLCPELVTVPARHDLYVDYHGRLMEEVANHLPIHKVLSIDEAACRLIGSECEPESAKKIARAMKAGIRGSVGECLSCSIGIAPSMLLAKIASDMQKPDGLVVIEAKDLPGPLLDRKLTDLPGIALNREAHLRRAGVTDVAAFWALAPKEARAVWGSVGGERYWYELHGVDLPASENGRRSIGHSRVLAPAMRTPAEARLVARALLLKAAVRLRRYGLAAGSLGLSARSEWRSRIVEETNFPPTQDSFLLLGRLDALWQRNEPHESLKTVSIWLTRLVPVETRARDLFVPLRPDGFTRGEALWRTLDKLTTRYGRDTVVPASQRGLSLQYLGAKIAFTRVPEPVEFSE